MREHFILLLERRMFMSKIAPKLTSKAFAAFSVIVFFSGLTTFAVSSLEKSNQRSIEPARPFRLIQIESEITSEGVEVVKRFRTQDVNVDGTWHSTVTSVDTNNSGEYALSADGLSATHKGEHLSLGSKVEAPELLQKTHTVEFYENHPDFVGTEIIAGIKVYKLKTPLSQKGGWLELASSPKTGAIPLRTILHRPDGSEHKIEAVKVEFLDNSSK
jgi:hypothetical protein